MLFCGLWFLQKAWMVCLDSWVEKCHDIGLRKSRIYARDTVPVVLHSIPILVAIICTFPIETDFALVLIVVVVLVVFTSFFCAKKTMRQVYHVLFKLS